MAGRGPWARTSRIRESKQRANSAVVVLVAGTSLHHVSRRHLHRFFDPPPCLKTTGRGPIGRRPGHPNGRSVCASIRCTAIIECHRQLTSNPTTAAVLSPRLVPQRSLRASSFRFVHRHSGPLDVLLVTVGPALFLFRGAPEAAAAAAAAESGRAVRTVVDSLLHNGAAARLL